MNIQIKRLNPNAKLPIRAKTGDAAYDLFALESEQIMPGQRKLIKTGIAMAIPEGFYGRIAERSGLSLKQGLKVGGGVVDSSYRGDVGVIAFNLSQGDENEVIQISAGDRIAQLIIERCYDAEWELVEELPASVRADAGFGSSGS